MKLYVINLDRAPERMARMERLLAAISVPFERVAAVDGAKLPPPPISADGAYAVSRSEIACANSHQKCWDLFSQSGDPYCVIIEDDVHFGSDFAAFMESPPTFPADFDLIKIESLHTKVWLERRPAPADIGGRRLKRLAFDHMGSAGYVLSRQGLEKLRRRTVTIDQAIDVILFGKPSRSLTNYQMVPSLIIQDRVLKDISPMYVGLPSAIADDSGRRPRLSVATKVVRELMRPFRSVVPPGPLLAKWRLQCREVSFE